MKRVGISAAVGLAIVVCVLFSQQQVVTADPLVAMKSDGECGMPGADADGNMNFGGVGEMTTVESRRGVTMTCSGTGITNDSGQLQVFEGFSCAISLSDGSIVFTQNSLASVTARGVATMSCMYVM